MSIECKASTAPSHKAEGAHGKGVKAKSAGDAPQEAGPLGFMAALSAAEESVDANPDDQDDGATVTGAVAQPLTPETLKPVDTDDIQTPAVPSTLSFQSTKPDYQGGPEARSRALLAGAQTARKNAGDGNDADPSSRGLNPLALAAGGATGLTDRDSGLVADTAVEGRIGSEIGTRVDAESSGGEEGAMAGMHMARFTPPPQAGKDGAFEPAVKGVRKTADKSRADRTATSTDASATAAAGTSLSGQAARETGELRFQAVMDLQKLLQPETEDVALVLPAPLKDEKRLVERSVFSVGTDPVQANPGNTSGAPDLTDLGFSGVAEVSVPPEVQVAEQVQFWISNDIQNAEMQLDGIGEKPVEVSITMHGNEAHVAFRSDELLARGALAGAESHLRDMLGREGVVLTGVSVGTSSGGGQGSEGRQQRQGERKSMMVAAANIPESRTIRGNSGSTGRSLDLFV